MPRSHRSDTPDDQARLEHILLAAQQAVQFAADRNRADLNTDDMLRRALINAIQEIGEAASRLSDAGKQRVSGVPWNLIVKMRNVLVHVYWGVDLDRLWQTIQVDLPPLIEAIRPHCPRSTRH